VQTLSETVFAHKGNVMGTKKVLLEGHFSMLMSVWVDGDAAALVKAVGEMAAGEGVMLKAVPLDVNGAPIHTGACERRLVVECKQKPGIILALTKLLKDAGCTLSHLDTNTQLKEGQMWFLLECAVSVPDADSLEELEDQLRFWADEMATTKLIFDQWPSPHMQPLSHA